MNKLLEYGRKAMFYVRVLSGYEERRIRNYRLQLEKRIQQAQQKKAEINRLPEQIVLSEVRRMVEEMQNLNKQIENTTLNENSRESVPTYLNIQPLRTLRMRQNRSLRAGADHDVEMNYSFQASTSGSSNVVDRSMMEEKEKAAEDVDVKEAQIEDYFKPIDKQAGTIMEVQLEGEKKTMGTMMNATQQEAIRKIEEAERLARARGNANVEANTGEKIQDSESSANEKAQTK